MNFINSIVDFLVDSILQGEAVLDLFNQYFLSQTDTNKVLMLYGVFGLTILGSVELVKTILQKTAGIIKFALVAAFVYYLIVVVLGFDIVGLFFWLIKGTKELICLEILKIENALLANIGWIQVQLTSNLGLELNYLIMIQKLEKCVE